VCITHQKSFKTNFYQEGCSLVDIVQADEPSETVKEIGVAERSELVAENSGLVRSLTGTDVQNSDLMSFVAEGEIIE
jgi:hypothetical protein